MAGKQPLKRSMLGLEVEVFTLDSSGKVIFEADKLINRIKEKEKGIDIQKECARNMVELGSFPSVQVPNTIDTLLKNFESLLLTAEDHDMVIFPLGTYPGKFTPDMRLEGNYKIKKGVFGKKRFEIAGRCIGFHCHYALPWGVFDQQNLTIKKLLDSKNKQSLIDSHNLLIALDPVLTTFMQSSPFYQGRFIGKDSRLIVYRGGKRLRYPEGLYTKYQLFGALQKYKQTGTDLTNYISNKHVHWKNILTRAGFSAKVLSSYGSILDTNWNPVKVNSHGTLEQRGMDMNHPLLILGISTFIKNILQKVQQEFIKVVPSDTGLKEPFKLEGKAMYIPPDSHVRGELQRASAYEGLDNNRIYQYCKRALKLVKQLTPKDESKFIVPFENMLSSRQTVSDELLLEAKKKGYKKQDALPQKVAAELALNHSKRLFKEIVLTRKLIQNA